MVEINLEGIEPEINLEGIEPEINLEGIEPGKDVATGGETFAYAFEKENNFTRDFTDYLETIVPVSSFYLGGANFPGTEEYNATGFYTSPTEKYGEAWNDASQIERGQLIRDKRAEEIEAEYGDKQYDEDSWQYVAGDITKAVADPTILIPFGGSVAKAVVVGGTIGGMTSAAEDLAKKGEIDIKDVAVDTLMAATFAGGLQYAVPKAATVFKNRAMRKKVDKAQKVIDNSNQQKATDALKEAGYTNKQIAEIGTAAKATNKKLIPRRISKTDPEVEADSLVTRHAHTQRDSTLDKALGSMSTRLMNVSPALGRKLRQYELGSRLTANKYAEQAEPFIKAYRGLEETTRKKVGFLLSNGKFEDVANLVGKDSPVGQTIPKLQVLLKEAGDELKSSGRVFEENPDYFPRLVKDYDKMSRELFGKDSSKVINSKITEYADKKGIPVSQVTNNQKDRIANDVLRSYEPVIAKGKPSNLKQRLLKELDESVHAEHYVNADEALATYISGLSHDIHINKLFGKFNTDNLEHSIGALVRELNLSSDKIADVSDILSARFKGGRQSANKLNQAVKDVGYMGTIGQFTSTVTQLSDLGLSSAMQGFRNTMYSFFEAAGNKSSIKLIDIGVDGQVMQEIASDPTLTSKILGKVLTGTGFRAIDRIGKESLINANFKLMQKQAKKNPLKIKSKWGKYYGDDVDQLITDLSLGKITPLTKEHAFATLSDFQPISMSEMPEYYARNPNTRILYMLKSFTLKMYDVVRKNVYNEWKAGNKVQAVKTMGVLGLYLSLSNTGTTKIKEFMSGKDVNMKPEDLPADMMWSLLGVFGFGKYQAGEAKREGVYDTVFNMVKPPMPIADVASGVYNQATTEQDYNDPYKESRKAVRNIPVVGGIVSNWFLGGAEAHNERIREERYKD